MPGSGAKNFQQAYNVQAVVDTETMLVVTPRANDKLEVEPTVKALEQLPDALGKMEGTVRNYLSEAITPSWARLIVWKPLGSLEEGMAVTAVCLNSYSIT